jgi:hypothetical protein
LHDDDDDDDDDDDTCLLVGEDEIDDPKSDREWRVSSSSMPFLAEVIIGRGLIKFSTEKDRKASTQQSSSSLCSL